MAKGLRASVIKRNNSKLRARVFGPVEDARTERLSAKLLELASQPKPQKEGLEIDKENCEYIVCTFITQAVANTGTAMKNEENTEEAEGMSSLASLSPASSVDSEAKEDRSLAMLSLFTGIPQTQLHGSTKKQAEEESLYHVLGLYSGFLDNGDLLLEVHK